MKPELEKKLYKDFPKIFKYAEETHDPIIPMAFGCECADGWYGIINHMCKMIQNDVDRNERQQVLAVQVKEKFGGLRFYIDGGSEKTYDIIHFFESLSYIVCEKCGKTNAETRNTKSWIFTRCEKCWEEYLKTN